MSRSSDSRPSDLWPRGRYPARVLSLLLLLVSAQSAPASARQDLTYGFTTERLEVELDTPSGRLRWTGDQHDADPVRPADALLLECCAAAAASCELRPILLGSCAEFYVGATALVPRDCRLSIDARIVQSRDAEEPGAWVRAFDLGSAGPEAPIEPTRVPATLIREQGHLRWLAEGRYLQLRLIARTTSASSVRVAISRISGAGFDRSRVSSRGWGPMPGMCGLTSADWNETEARYRKRSRSPQPVPFVAARDPGDACGTAGAVLAMLLSQAEPLSSLEECGPESLLAAAGVHAKRATLECYSIWPAVEMALGGGGPFAIRVQDAAGATRWVVLSSFDEKLDALVYDPSSKQPQPVHWTRDELEKRWFGAGGLALACSR